MSELEPPDQVLSQLTDDEESVLVAPSPKAVNKKRLVIAAGSVIAIVLAVVVLKTVTKTEDPLKSKVYKELLAKNNDTKSYIANLEAQVETSTAERDGKKTALKEMQQRVARNQEQYDAFIKGNES